MRNLQKAFMATEKVLVWVIPLLKLIWGYVRKHDMETMVSHLNKPNQSDWAQEEKKDLGPKTTE